MSAMFAGRRLRLRCWGGVFSAVLSLLGCGATASAQGLIWSLPEDGAWVRFEGTYEQTDSRPESPQGSITLKWIRQITIKSVGQQTAVYQGQQQPCRWIEIKLSTGKPSESGLDAGPIGTRLYKVLVPEAAIRGSLVDLEGIPVAFLPIVKGYRRIGTEEVEPQAIQSGVLHVYPVLTMIRHYKSFEAAEEPEDPQVGVAFVKATRMTGSVTVESPTIREKHQTELWRTNEIPFGLARWKVRVDIEGKDITDKRADFQPVSSITVEMKAAEVGRDARSELAVQ